MTRIIAAFAAATCLALAVPAIGATDHDKSYEEPDSEFDEPVPGAKRLEGRLLSPCCWDSTRQTLDIHGSPIANQLRREIRSRLRSGETPDAIEADLVGRYTTKILAVPPGNPLREIGIGLTVLVIVGGAGAASMLLRWRRAGQRTESATPVTEPDEWDERLDRELADQDD